MTVVQATLLTQPFTIVQDRMELLDILRAAKWDVNEAAKNAKSEGAAEDFVPDEKPKAAAPAKKGSGWKKPKLPSVKSHHAPEENNRRDNLIYISFKFTILVVQFGDHPK